MNGRGMAIDPYLIHSIADIEMLRDRINSGESYEEKIYVKLKADLILSDRNWIPIGTDTSPFKGCFDGEGHTITHVKVDQGKKDYMGLFGVVENSQIRNIRLLECHIQGRQYVGAIVGKMSVNSIVEKCSATGDVVGNGNHIGGIVGYSDYYNTISKCYSEIDVQAEGKNVGGIVGYSSYKCVIQNCYSLGSIQTIADDVGGIVGYNGAECKVKSCYSTGKIKGSTCVGGIVGKSEQSEDIGIVENCIALNLAVVGDSSGRVIGVYSESGINNYAFKRLLLNGARVQEGEIDNKDGEDLSREQINTEYMYLTKEFSYGNGWILRMGKLPILAGMKGQRGEMPNYLKLAKPISTVKLEMRKPHIGEVPQQEVIASHKNYRVREVVWQPAHKRFEPDTCYRATIELEAIGGYEFRDLKVLLDYQEVEVDVLLDGLTDQATIQLTFPKTQLPKQEGAPRFVYGMPPTIDKTISIGEGSLLVTSNLTYNWYRTPESSYPLRESQLVSQADDYTPTEDDLGYYLVVIATTPDAIGEGYVMTEQVSKPIYGGEVRTPLLDKLTQNSVTLKAIPGYEYSCVLKGEGGPFRFTKQNQFLGLIPNTAYDFYQRVEASNQYEASKPSKLSITTSKIMIHTLVSPPMLPENAVIDGEPIYAPYLTPTRTNIEGVELATEWYAYDEDNQPIPLDGSRLGSSDEVYLFKAILTVPSSEYCFDAQFKKRVGITLSNAADTLTYTFRLFNIPKEKKEETKRGNRVTITKNTESKANSKNESRTDYRNDTELDYTPAKKTEKRIESKQEEKRQETKKQETKKQEVNEAVQQVAASASEYAKRYNDIEVTEKMSGNHMGVWNLQIRS